jgi:hypothetical protein
VQEELVPGAYFPVNVIGWSSKRGDSLAMQDPKAPIKWLDSTIPAALCQGPVVYGELKDRKV